MRLFREGQLIAEPADILRDPFVFEFLKIPDSPPINEKDLETRLCDHLQPFLLELGKGFTFVGRQHRVPINNRNHRFNLVFYHRILRCFVLIDLKFDEVEHHDIGQMNLYLGYFAAEENIERDKPPISIILTRNKDELVVEYATYEMNSQLFVQKYPLYLHDREELRREFEQTLLEANADAEFDASIDDSDPEASKRTSSVKRASITQASMRPRSFERGKSVKIVGDGSEKEGHIQAGTHNPYEGSYTPHSNHPFYIVNLI